MEIEGNTHTQIGRVLHHYFHAILKYRKYTLQHVRKLVKDEKNL